ncbi:Os04g0120350 [Oryza sativa Japonica Group]|uniref:Os04g0120350 protein n=1 Tax=Oryza sativa subsp. japonica TaxID=39947 RepID=A0A0P0W6B4_ORYSJ|nr:Os04g0120350 [Oryza sativa Japonica Group]
MYIIFSSPTIHICWSLGLTHTHAHYSSYSVFTLQKLPFVTCNPHLTNPFFQHNNSESGSYVPKAKISLTQSTIEGEISAPKVTAFSLWGCSSIYPGVVKTDIDAPRVSVIATAQTSYDNGTPYHISPGTSMSFSHV